MGGRGRKCKAEIEMNPNVLQATESIDFCCHSIVSVLHRRQRRWRPLVIFSIRLAENGHDNKEQKYTRA